MAASDRRQVLEELKQPDPFMEIVLEAREYFDNNRSRVLGIGGAVAAVFFAAIGGWSYYSAEARRAAGDFSSAISSLEFDSPSAAEVSLKSLATRSNAGPYKPLAALYRGDLATDAGRYDEAIAAYDEFLAGAPTDYLRQIGLMGKAAALQGAGKAAEAAPVLDQAAAIDGPYRKAALSDRARLAEKAGDKELAKTTLQKILEIGGTGPGSAEIEKRLQALQ